jgi:hypothetical protein
MLNKFTLKKGNAMDEKDKTTTDATTSAKQMAEVTPDPEVSANAESTTEAKTEVKADAEPDTVTTASEPAPVTPPAQPVVAQPKSKKPWLIALAVVVIAAVAVTAYLMLSVSKNDYKEALTTLDEAEKSLNKQFDKSLNIIKNGPARANKNDRKELEELVQKNQQAMDTMAKFKAFSKDAELKKKFDELRDKQKEADAYAVMSVETVLDVAPVRHNYRNIQQAIGSQAKINYIKRTVEDMKKIDAKSDFNKDFLKTMLEIYEDMLEKAKQSNTINLNTHALKATQALSKWIDAVRNQMKKENPMKGSFEAIKNYLKPKAE